jgi:hypothetical protein
MVLNDRLWRSRFGSSPNVIGRTLNLSGIDFQAIGVMPKDFHFPLKETQLWAPAAALPNWQARWAEAKRASFGPGLARLRPGATLD